MKKYLYSIVLMPVVLAAQQFAPITDAQADAIVASEMAAKEAKRQAETPDFQVLQRRIVELGDGGTLVMEAVAKPQLKERAESQPAALSPEQVELLDEIEEGKHQFLSLNVWVYDKNVSLIRWTGQDGEQYSAWTRADMNPCRVIRDFSTGEVTYTLAAMVFNESTKDLKERQELARSEGIDLQIPVIPDLPQSNDGVTEYFVETDDPSILDNEEVFAGLDALMRHLDQNQNELKEALHNQQKISEAKKRYREDNQQPKQTTFIHWVPEQ